MTEYDPFKGESGLKDDFDGVVVDAWFAVPEQSNDRVVVAYLKVLADDGDEVEQRYRCGPDWATFDGGETVQHPKDTAEKLRGFNNRTKYFKLFDTAMKAGAEDELRSRSAANNNCGPRAAALWKGLRFHYEIESEDIKFIGRDGNEVVTTTNTALPTKYLGVGDASASATAQASGGNGGAGAATTAADPMAGLSAEVQDQIGKLAKNTTFGDFQDAVMQLDGVLQNPSTMTAITSPIWYVSLRA